MACSPKSTSHRPPESGPLKISADRTWPQKPGIRSRASARLAIQACKRQVLKRQVPKRQARKQMPLHLDMADARPLPPDEESALLARLAIKYGSDKWGVHF